MKEMGGLGTAIFVQQEFCELVFSILRADLMIAEHYLCREGSIFDGDLCIMAGEADRYLDMPKLARWEHQCTGRF